MNNPFDILDKKLVENYQNIYNNEIKISETLINKDISDEMKEKYPEFYHEYK